MSGPMDEQLNVGEDSFMDTIANLVGVLIILVAIVSLHAEKIVVPRGERPEQNQAREELASALNAATRTANAIEIDSQRLEQDLAAEQRLAASLAEERREKMIWLELARRQIAEQKAALDERAQRRLEMVAEETKLQQQLDELQRQRRAQAAAAAVPKEIELVHYPTPIAKTVFSDEVHFRLENGRLAYVPLNELLEQMKAEWKYKAEKLGQDPSTVELIGPIENFRMEYELVAESPDPSLPLDPNRGMIVRFNKFLITPMGANTGEPLAVALGENSQFRQRLQRLPPGKTTISIWVYPESYEQLLTLRSWLREQGYQTACWPLESGRPITGGPNGLRTTAQ
ncbi:MAG: hypothetical protein ACK493_08335 [Planctomycetota bacterium]|jgi:hypothetical protein|nr:hypothetical protein [Blastopirellula sp.]